MPPKRKDSKKSLKPNSEGPLINNSTSPQSFPIEKHPSIPKKPIFKVIKCHTETRARLIQIKLWKAHALHLRDSGNHYSGNYQFHLMTSKTSQKALKNLRRLTLDSRNSSDAPRRFLMAQKFKSLNKLQLSIPLNPRILKLLKTSINPNLNSLCIENSRQYDPRKKARTWESYLQLLLHFQNLQYLALDPQTFNEIPGNTSVSTPRLKKLRVLQWQHFDPSLPFRSFLFHPKLSRYLTQLQDLHLYTTTWFPYHQLFSSMIPLHRIQNLALKINSDNLPFIDFTLFSRFPNLESLSLSIRGENSTSIYDLSFLSNLKSFSFQTSRPVLFSPNFLEKDLPKLESLELRCEDFSLSPFAFEKKIISKAVNLKALKILLPAQSLPELLEFDFSLEEFSLEVQKINPPFNAFSKALSTFLKQNSNVKSLQLYFHESFHDFFEPVMKSLQSFTGLETLKLGLRKPVELKDRKIPLLNNVLLKLEGLKSVHLEFPYHSFDSREVSSLVGALMKCERLEELILNTTFMKTSDASFEKFVDFVKEAKGMKLMKLDINGFSQDRQRELSKALGHDISCWEDPLMKISTDRIDA